ncbi:MAG: inositol-3-phosphate synthase [Deltaproteobacteria bacterium]|nr:inositol-3-phosphate synthase [Deltaproteobacteria bacterium]MBW1931505.1 inositol-3-phosphate synthase [Deltaproteobacteria bacterium]MBW1979058.1 inositol-3-phosphate synthase [Deltaproteobacteria bacterium]MBW2045160.1 inositol-3-phosphate synthase [Deltaproteobacteria bacterium]MBW2301925.1 inositol-3-phosphate synthase [Deltaproteobacteria bacterium]
MKRKQGIEKAGGKLGVLIPGLGGAVSTTFMAGVEAVRSGISAPIGSLTQLGTIRLGKRFEGRVPAIKDLVPLAELEDLVFGGWDIYPDNCYEAAIKAGVLNRDDLQGVEPFLKELRPWPGVFKREFVKNLSGTHVKPKGPHLELVESLREDIDSFKREHGISRCVMIWCASTEVYVEPGEVHSSLSKFEKGLKENDPAISPSMIYAYAALRSGVPFINGAPNLTVDIPAMTELASKQQVPITGKDFKTGQTLMKTVLAPGLKARMLGLTGWYSTNILGNRDGLVLDDEGSFKTKEQSKLSALETILQPDVYPKLYSDFKHKVVISYYPPRGDQKEGWDAIDIFGWLGYPMQIKVNFLCRDSILAAPVVLDLVLFMDLAQRAAMSGIQEWLSFYFKSPQCAPNLYPEHDLFIQLTKLKNTLRYLMGEEQITHLGLDYYYET